MIDTLELEKVFSECLYKTEEVQPPGPEGQQIVPDGAVIVDGIMCKFAFHPGRLAEAKPKVIEWLKQLPLPFHESSGGGWTFLNACMTESGEHWGEHRNMDQLFCLGLGLKLVTCMLPRELWKSLPGGVPYYGITKEVNG